MIDPKARKPSWLKTAHPGGPDFVRVSGVFARRKLNTVCKEARCPNIGECWGHGTATVMILGDVCTRSCRFCAVASGHPHAVDTTEPQRVADAVVELRLRHVVLTMVSRDDLPDGGASHVAQTVRALRGADPSLTTEVLVGDFSGCKQDIDTVLASKPDVFAHNIEVVRRLTHRVRDAKCDYDRSMDVLAYVKSQEASLLTKSSLMVGVGETDDEIYEWLRDMRRIGVDIVTMGQYMRPSVEHVAVDRYVTPEQFEKLGRAAEEMGHRFVASDPLVRSSYRAGELFAKSRCVDGAV